MPLSRANCKKCGREFSPPEFGELQTLCPECRAAAPQPVLANTEPQARPVATMALIGANVIAFLVLVLSGASFFNPSADDLLKLGASFGPSTLGGQWWRLLTSMFLHGGIIHLLFNMWCLWDLGWLAERLFGRAAFTVLYLLSGIGGTVASLWWHPQVVGVGASGAIFGIAGLLAMVFYRAHLPIPREHMKEQFRSLAAFVGYNLFLGLTRPHVDNAAHVGGLITGGLMGLALAPSFAASFETARKRLCIVGITAAILLALGTGAVRRLHWPLVQVHQAQQLSEAGRNKEAIATLRQVIAAHPNLSQARFLLAYTLAKDKQPTEALAEYRSLLKREPRYAAAHYNAGLLLLQLERPAEAEIELREAARLEPSDANAWLWLGIACSAQEKQEPAVESLRKAVALDAKLPLGHLWLGRALQAKGQHEAALAEFLTAAELDPKSAEAFAGLAAEYAALGQAERAEGVRQHADKLRQAEAPKNRPQ